jgi:hypothetical protein
MEFGNEGTAVIDRRYRTEPPPGVRRLSDDREVVPPLI